MAEIYTKDNQGNTRKIGNANADQLSRIHNDVNSDDIKSAVKSYWTDKKCGKLDNLQQAHETILSKYLKVKAEDFFEQLRKNNFTCCNFGPFSWGKFLRQAEIDQLVAPEYFDAAFSVHVGTRPEIGKGEFLFVSSFNNLNFASESGDIVTNGGKRIEVKGKSSYLGGEGPYQQWNKNLLYSIYAIFGTNGPTRAGTEYTGKDAPSHLTLDVIDDIQKKIKDNPEKMVKVMYILQNRKNHSRTLATQMAKLFNSKQDLKTVIAASHLLTYMSIQKADMLIALNDHVYYGFMAPRSLEDAYEIMSHFNINAWVTGNKGISITVKNGK